ncbi:hypothetical protein ACOMHN_046505 [Nucella lapillus]
MLENDEVGISLPDDEVILLQTAPFLEDLNKYLTSVDKRSIANYLMSKVAKNFMQYLSPDIRDPLLDLSNTDMTQSVLLLSDNLMDVEKLSKEYDNRALQYIVDRFAEAAKANGLTTRLKKTLAMYQSPTREAYSPPRIRMDGTSLHIVVQFTYLSSILSNDAAVSENLDNRLA